MVTRGGFHWVGSWSQVSANVLELQRQSMQATFRRSRLYEWASFLFLWVVLLGCAMVILPHTMLNINSHSVGLLLLYAALLIPLAMLPLCLLMAWITGRKIRDEEKLSAALALLSTLEVDWCGKGKVHLELDLRDLKKCPAGRPGKAQGEKWGPWIPYRQRWLRLRAQMALGKRLDLRLTRKFRHKLYPKRATCREKQVCLDRVEAAQGRVEHRRDTQQSYAQLVNEVLAGLIGLYRANASGQAGTQPADASPPQARPLEAGDKERPPIPD